MLATIAVELHGAVPVARISGEVDASNAHTLTEQLKDAVPNSAMGLVLELSSTDYIDSSGVHLIFDLADALRRRQQSLQLVVPPETFVADVMAAVGLGGTAGVYQTVADAAHAVETTHF